MKARALLALRPPAVRVTSRRIKGPPGKNVRWVTWDDPVLHVTGDLRRSADTWPGKFTGTPRSVTYGPGARGANATAVHTCTDAAWIEVLQLGSGYNSRLTAYLDGRPVHAPAVEFPSDGGLYLTRFDFGTKARRCLKLQFNAPHFGGLVADRGARFFPPPARKTFRVLFVGDSFTESSEHWAVHAAKLLGWHDVWLSGVGGTGFINAPGNKLNFQQRLDSDVLAYRPDVLVIAGGINDSRLPPPRVQAAAQAVFDRIQRGLPNTLVFVLGPWNPRSAISPAINQAIKTAAAGRANFHWVPNYGDRWISGTGYVGGRKGDGNSDWIIGADGTHPTAEGHRYLGDRFAAHVRTALGIGPKAPF